MDAVFQKLLLSTLNNFIIPQIFESNNSTDIRQIFEKLFNARFFCFIILLHVKVLIAVSVCYCIAQSNCEIP